jgi:hypothetical protein
MLVMKHYLLLAAASLGLLTTSCYYDPYTSGSVSYGATSYGSGYSSSVFVSTGDPRWAYDPYRYAYYCRYTSRYYDPYRYGFYPVGYCPVPVRGCPHPYNWSGSGYCPPPRTIHSHTLTNCDNRVNYYRSANHAWSRHVSGSGSSAWMNSAQRSQLERQSKTPSWNQGDSSWRSGGYQPSSQLGQSGRSRIISSPRPITSPQWQGSQSPSRSFQSQAPQIQPRPTGGGMFGGMDRSSGRSASPQPSIQRPTPSRNFDAAPQRQRSTPFQRETYSPPAPQAQPSRDSDTGRSFGRDSGRESPFRRMRD